MKKITFIGLGVMGFPMAGHLSKKGYDVTVYNRSEEKSKLWVDQHVGTYSTSINEAVKGSDIVFSCVGNDSDLIEITLGNDRAFSAMKAGSFFVDHTTTSSDIAVELYEKAKESGLHFLDAPVSGGEVGAVKGELTVMIGGENLIFDKIKPIIEGYAKNVTLIGGPGKGQLAKMVNQICIAGLVQGLSEGINFGMKAGLKMEDVIEVISKGAAQSWQMDNRYKTMIDDKFDFGFAVDWMRKDLKIAMDEAKNNGSLLPITEIIDKYYGEVQELGGKRWDTSSLIKRFRK